MKCFKHYINCIIKCHFHWRSGNCWHPETNPTSFSWAFQETHPSWSPATVWQLEGSHARALWGAAARKRGGKSGKVRLMNRRPLSHSITLSSQSGLLLPSGRALQPSSMTSYLTATACRSESSSVCSNLYLSITPNIRSIPPPPFLIFLILEAQTPAAFDHTRKH